MPGKILIVDDDPDFRFILGHVLKKAGYTVVSASNGSECFEKVEKEKPDMVIVDIMMRGMDGWDVCKKLKEIAPKLPISICSILRDSRSVDRSFSYAGANEHMTKPLNIEQTIITVNSLLMKI